MTGAPLDPSPDEARRVLLRELARPEYVDDNPLQRLLDWIGRQIEETVAGARGLSPVSWFALSLIALLLLGALAFLVSRARTTARTRDAGGAVLTAETVSAAELRARAEQALAAGRYDDAVLDGYRALARRQVERGRLDDDPGVTALEVARTLATEFPPHAAATTAGAEVFDAVLYGGRAATREQADDVLALDATLAGAR